MFAHEFMRQRLPGRDLRRARLRGDRLLRRPPRPRSSPATRSATSPSPGRRRGGGRRSTSGSASSPRRSSSALGIGGCSASAARADDVGDRHRLRLDPRPRRALPLDLRQRLERRRRHRRGPRPLRLDPRASPPATPGSPRWSRRRLPRRSPRSPGRCCSPRLDPEVARGLGVPVRALGHRLLRHPRRWSPPRRRQAVGALLLLGLLVGARRRGAPADRPSLARPRPLGGDRRRLDLARPRRSPTRSTRCRPALRYRRRDRGLPPRRPARPGRAALARRRAPERSAPRLGSNREHRRPRRAGPSTPSAALPAPATGAAGRARRWSRRWPTHDCAVTALDLDDELRRREPRGRPGQRLPGAGAARAARPGAADRGLPRDRRASSGWTRPATTITTRSAATAAAWSPSRTRAWSGRSTRSPAG